MQFPMCQHGNVGMTCPQCRGRAQAVAAPAAPTRAQGSGFSAARALQPGAEQAQEVEIEALYDSRQDPKERFAVLMAAKLGEIVDRSERNVVRAADRQAAQHKQFWQQVNAATTVAAHQAEHE